MPDPEAIFRIFGSPEAEKAEIMSNWALAAAHPDGERIHEEGMRRRDFPYPYSMPGLLACKAAELQGGQAAHWDIFDRVQQAHAVETRNIADLEVLRACVREMGLDVARSLWGADFVGGPAEVTEKMLYQQELFGHDRFLVVLTVGTLPHRKVLRAIELLGTEVVPVARRETAGLPAEAAEGARAGLSWRCWRQRARRYLGGWSPPTEAAGWRPPAG